MNTQGEIMFITVNGEKINYEENMTVTRVLQVMNYIFRMLLVKINGQLIHKKDYATTIVPAGATVEVIHMISGG
jgi:sulfur carrier protein